MTVFLVVERRTTADGDANQLRRIEEKKRGVDGLF